jgi:DNA-binding Lrp family transcriptional regulator
LPYSAPTSLGGKHGFWGSRSVVDPRITPAEIARHIGKSRTAVQARIKSWTRDGFLLGHEVWPNPRLFGVGLCTLDIPVKGPDQVDRVFEDLALIEGVISARELMDEDGRTVRAYVVDDGPPALTRRRQLIRRVTGLHREPEAVPYWIPETDCVPTGLDWRIISYYRSFPAATPSEAVASLGVGIKTLSRRRDRLIDGHAMWWLMNTRSSKFPVASFFVNVTAPAQLSSVKQWLESKLSGWIPCADDGFGLPPTTELRTISGLSMAETPASVEDVARLIASCPEVASVRWRIPRDFRSYREWFDHGLLNRLADASDLRVRIPPDRPTDASSLSVPYAFSAPTSYLIPPVEGRLPGSAGATPGATSGGAKSRWTGFGGRRVRRPSKLPSA